MTPSATPPSGNPTAELQLGDFLASARQRWRLFVITPFGAAAVAVGMSYLIPPTFTARTAFMPPAQGQQTGAAGALASLGALAGVGAGLRNSGDQYLAFVQSRTVSDRMIDRFDLMRVYDADWRQDARASLNDSTRATLGKKDGIIQLEVDDHDPKRAADMANAYVDEIRKLAGGLILTEAQQRRVFFEGQLKQVKSRLEAAQAALQGSGVSAAEIKIEPKATVEALAKLQAELTSAEVRLQAMRSSLADRAPEVESQSALVASLRSQVARASKGDQQAQSSYVGAYREYKYQEALFDQLARQYELARVDESRDGGQLQVIDVALIPERKSKPKRSLLAILGFGLGLVGIAGHTLWRRQSKRSA
jgi:uncharacterized protein involved in exopolysaccharide biosynthesis